MRTNPADLLKLLGSGVRPAQIGTSLGAAAASIDFAQLLSSASAGTITSDRPVTVRKGASCALSEAQLNRLAPVVDSAEAAGTTQLLAFLDGKALKVDVLTREVLDSVDPLQAVVAGVDGVAIVPAADSADTPVLYSPNETSESTESTLQGLARHVRNRDLASLLDPTGQSSGRSETGSGN